jgi:hypothetical protein
MSGVERAKPNFFIIGAPKFGTTSLAGLLAQHDEVYFCPEKEPRFFSHESTYERGFDNYESLFDGADDEMRIGEGSTTYSEAWLGRYEKSARRLFDYCPEARLIYCVRHPLHRIQSNWLDIIWALDNNLMQGTELHRSGELTISGDFNDDVLANEGLVQTLSYWRVLQAYRRHFSDAQIQVVFLDDLKSHPGDVLNTCCAFLDIDPEFDFADPDEARNASSNKGLAMSLGNVVRSIPGYSTLVGWTPDVLRTALRPLIKETFTEKPEWEPGARREVVSVLKSNTKAFLDYANKPHDHWSL